MQLATGNWRLAVRAKRIFGRPKWRQNNENRRTETGERRTDFGKTNKLLFLEVEPVASR
jgi:hypothetical protein